MKNKSLMPSKKITRVIKMQKKYDSSSIKVLKGLDAVRKRPGMYIGDTDDGSGLHHMIFEVLDNSIDEALAGYCNEISIVLNKDGSVSIIDNGRGIPIELHPEEGKSAAEVIMTVLHAGAKFDDDSYQVSGGLHGVGVSVVNALSEKLELKIWRNGKEYEQRYINGVPESDIRETGETKKKGTLVKFSPSSKIFSSVDFDYHLLSKRFRELSFLNSGIKIILKDEINNRKDKFYHTGGISAFVEYISAKRHVLFKEIIYINGFSKTGNIAFDLAMQWNDSSCNNILCFTNNIPQTNGGSHLSALKSSLTRTVNNYIEAEGFKKGLKFNILGDDIREGLCAVISVRLSNPRFSSQTKDKLISSEIKPVIESIINERLQEFLLENPSQAKIIVNKAIQAACVREEERKIREITRKKKCPRRYCTAWKTC